MLRHNLASELLGKGQDSAVVTTGHRMSNVIRLSSVEEQNVIRVGDNGFSTALANEHATPYEHDTMLDIRFLRPFCVDVSSAAKILDGYTQSLGQHPPRLGRLDLLYWDVTHSIHPDANREN
jgi:hypothetical protein